MAAKWIEMITGSLEQKKQYRQDVARINALPEPYASAAKAMNRYTMYVSGVTDGETSVAIVTGIADLWERAAVDGTPVRTIVGDDPVAFAEDFALSFGGKQWQDKERARLAKAIEDAEKEQER